MSEVIDILGQAEIMDHGQIAIMQLPDWELEDVETGTIASKKIYRHPDHPDVQFVF